MDTKKLAYNLIGQKIDFNTITLTHTNILWRSGKEKEDIQNLLLLIKARLEELMQNLGIESNLVQFFNPVLVENDLNTNNHAMKSQDYYAPQPIFTCPTQEFYKLFGYSHSYRHKHLIKQLQKRKTNFMKKELLIKYIKHTYQPKKHDLIRLRSNNLQDKTIKHSVFVNMNAFLCQNKNWIEEYKQSIKPVLCGGFYIRPSWHKENKEYPNIIINPALSFGSGHHATTAMCIDFLSTLSLCDKDLLDVGCGSGILSLVGAKLGANIYCCDTDLEACKQSKKNFANNGLYAQSLWHGSIKDIPKNTDTPTQYDCICANLVSSIIVILANDLIHALKPNAILILSGILEEHEQRIIEAFSSLVLLEKKQIDEWIGLKFMKK